MALAIAGEPGARALPVLLTQVRVGGRGEPCLRLCFSPSLINTFPPRRPPRTQRARNQEEERALRERVGVRGFGDMSSLLSAVNRQLVELLRVGKERKTKRRV